MLTAIITVYLCAMLGVGWWSKGRAKDRNGFFVAHRSASLPLVTGSLVATAVGASSTIGMAGLGFSQGLTGAWWLLVGCIGLVFLGIFFARKVRSAAVYTLPELVERQYDHRVSLAASILIVIAWVGVVAGQIVAAGKILAPLGKGSPQLWMSIFTAVFLAYSLLGGQYSVIRTDLFQAALICCGVFLTAALILSRTGGIHGLQDSLPPGYFSFPLSARFDGKALASYLVLVGSTYAVGPDMYSRLLCAKEEKTAQRSAILAALVFIPLSFAITVVGMGARVLYPEINAENAFPRAIIALPSAALSGLLLAALLAALMSSADTCVLTQSIILSEDVIKRVLPVREEKKTVWLTRLNLTVLSVVALGLALILKTVISSLLFAYTIFTCGLVVPVIAGFYRQRINVTSQGTLIAMIGGGFTALLGRIPWLDIPLKGDLGLVGFGFSAVLLFAVSLLTRKGSRQRANP